MIKTVPLVPLVSLVCLLAACGGEPGGASSSPQASSSQPGTSATFEMEFDNHNTAITVYSEQPKTFYQAVAVDWPGFDRSISQVAFEQTLYPVLLSSGCQGCHSSATAGQAPLHSDIDPQLAHEFALTKIHFYQPQESRLVERLAIDRHHCPPPSCADSAQRMQTAVGEWLAKIETMIPAPPPLTPTEALSEADIEAWINADKARRSEMEQSYHVYVSLHELQNAGLAQYELNIVRAALSKALNSTARWSPQLVNPTDITGDGLLYRFDIRDYWGYNQGVRKLLYAGSDTAFGASLAEPIYDYLGRELSSSSGSARYDFSGEIEPDAEHAKLIWQRILHGNAEATYPVPGDYATNIEGFKGARQENAAGEYVHIDDLEWVEATQLIYTLSRPDVYNAVMMNPLEAVELERNLEVDISRGADSYEYAVVFDGIPVDSRMLWRAKRPNDGWYYKTWDVFTRNPSTAAKRNIFEVYTDPNGEHIRFPFWAHPIPQFVSPVAANQADPNYSFVATLAQASSLNTPAFTDPQTAGCEPYTSTVLTGLCRHFTGTGGYQQSASEIIYSLENGLQGYFLTGGFNQRRVNAATDIVRDPRVLPGANDDLAYLTGFYALPGASQSTPNAGLRDLIVGSSCMGCHAEGMHRFNNDLRHRLDHSPQSLPSGPHGADAWLSDQDTVARVRELYPTNHHWQQTVEKDRKGFLDAMSTIRQGMILGEDKNLYVEPIIWTVEYVQNEKYRYPKTQFN